MDINRYRILGLEKKFSRELRNKAYLVTLEVRDRSPGFLEESAKEMTELARAATVRILGMSRARIHHPSPSHFLREGKLIEVRDEVERLGANVVIFNVDLTPTQTANIELFVKVPAVDRTGLILEIFGRRAVTHEGKLQVELAQLNYTLPRLGGLGTVMSRLGAGIGSRGPGEQELENDRRKVRNRIHRVKIQLDKVRKHRELIRAGRRRKRFVTVALVGYTNAGKSMLHRALTGSRVPVDDQMFATLDPVTRLDAFNGEKGVLFIDTVGFLKDLPHALIESFHATLEEAAQADILIHVLDVSVPHAEKFKEAADQVLKEIKADRKPAILVLNKADLLEDSRCREVQDSWPAGILISAKKRQGLHALMIKLGEWVAVARKNFSTASGGA